MARTEKSKSSFYHDSSSEWNNLCPDIRESPLISKFKKKLLSQIRSAPNSLYITHNSKGDIYLTNLRVGLSKLKVHKFKYDSKDTLNPMCPVYDDIEDMGHLLICNSFSEHRWNLPAGVNDVLEAYKYIEASDIYMLPSEANDLTLNLTIMYNSETNALVKGLPAPIIGAPNSLL